MNKKSTVRRESLVRASLRGVALASLVCCAGLAQAQEKPASSLTLYGILDAGVTYTSGIKGGNVKQVASGIMEGTRWGLKGNEEIGNGYRAIFTLEARVELDTGSNSSKPISGTQLPDRLSKATLMGLPAILQPAVTNVGNLLGGEFGVNVGTYGNRIFDRQAYMGLITPVGAVLAGRQYTPAFETTATYDIMATQSALAPGQLVPLPASLEIRSSNAIAYRIMKDGVSAAVMMSQGNAGENPGDGSRLVGWNFSYTASGLSAGMGYNAMKNELGQPSLATLVMGASGTMSGHTVSGLIAKVKDDNPAGLSAITPALTPVIGAVLARDVQNAFARALRQDGVLSHVGYRFVTGPNTISVAYNAFNDKRPNNSDVKSFGAAYTYALSKRTDINVVAVKYTNDGMSQVAPGGNGYLGGVTTAPGTDSNALAVGLRHRF
jgi:predicted porin